MVTKQSAHRQASPGMTLVELIVVMAIFSIVIMAVFSLVIPTQQSTVAQTRVADLQQGLRLAVNVMTQDLLKAGFLVADDQIIFEGNPTGTPASDPDDFTIRTRIVGNDFARINDNDGNMVESFSGTLPLSNLQMEEHFPADDVTGQTNQYKVRLFNPLTSAEVIAGVYTVTNPSSTDGNITLSGFPDPVAEETMVVKIPADATPEVQSIRYRFNNGALERIVNGNTQILARDLTGVSFSYGWTSPSSPPQRVRRVDILLQGQTRALKEGDVLSGAKGRDVRASVALRNVF